jgi:hypothetical protein
MYQEFIILLFLLSVLTKADDLITRNTDRQLRTRKKQGRTYRRAIRPTGDPETVRDAKGNVRLRRSRLNLRQLILGDEEDDIDIQLMSDQEAQSIRVRRDDTKADPFESWFGLDKDTGSSFTMVKTVTHQGREVTTGTLYGKNGTVYQIRSLADGDVVAEEVKQEMFPKDIEGPETNSEDDDDIDPDSIDQIDGLPSNRRQLRRLDSSSEIDIMVSVPTRYKDRNLFSCLNNSENYLSKVLYSRGAMCAAAGYGSGGACTVTANNLATIEGLINLAISETNQAFQLSSIPTRLRLVKTHYDDTFNEYLYTWIDALSLIRNNGDGQLDYVHAMRDQFGADFVSMIVDIATDCGIGYRPLTPTAGDAFSLVKWSCATGYYSFAHELAHNMGCNHDRANAGTGDSGIYYGYQDPASEFRTIMAYNCIASCKRIQYFSNPSMNYQGRPLGNEGADNVSWINRYLADFANYRQSVGTISYLPTPTTAPAPTPIPTAASTRPPTMERVFTTDLSGGNVGLEGNMFDIRAKTNIYIRNFAVHSSAATSVTIEVWKKTTAGTCAGATMNAALWQFIGQASFVTSPAGTASILPAGTFSAVFVKAGDIQAFYITFSASTNYNRYSTGQSVGTVFRGNEDLEVLQGYGKKYRFGAEISPRIWNGVIYYEIDNNPSLPLSTSQPTLQPIMTPMSAPTITLLTSPSIQPTVTSPMIVVSSPQTTLAPTLGPNPIPTLVSTTPSISLPRQKLLSPFDATVGQAGNMIEIQAIQSLVVRSFDLHTVSMSDVNVLVYGKKGTYVGFESKPNNWIVLVNTTILGKGSLIPTPIPERSFPPISLMSGEIYSFYITLTEPRMRYSKYSSNSILPSDSNLRFLRSSGNMFPFGESYANRLWNGIVYYSTVMSSSVGDKQL